MQKLSKLDKLLKLKEKDAKKLRTENVNMDYVFKKINIYLSHKSSILKI